MPEVTDLQKVAQYAKSSGAPSDVYNAACRLLDQPNELEIAALRQTNRNQMARAGQAEDAIHQIRLLAEQAKVGGFGQLCCCFDCEDAQENGRDAPHEPTWTAWTLDPAAVLAVIKATESHRGGRTPQTLGAGEGQATTEAYGGSQ